MPKTAILLPGKDAVGIVDEPTNIRLPNERRSDTQSKQSSAHIELEEGIDPGHIKEIEALISEGILTPEQGGGRIERIRAEAAMSADETDE